MRQHRRMSLVLAAAALLGALTACGTGNAAIRTGPGVTKEPCPGSVDHTHGCIYLGVLSDLSTGTFHVLGIPITEAEKAFWRRVNEQGGIGGYDVDVTTYVRDNKYDPQVQKREFAEIKNKVLAFSQTFGSPTTAAIMGDLRAERIMAVPVSWSSAWAFENLILTAGASYCFQAMNAIDYEANTLSPRSVMAVHYPGDYGDDAAAGVRTAAGAHSMTYTSVPTGQGAERQGQAVDAIVRARPDLVVLATNSADASAIMVQANARGFRGRYLGSNAVWDKTLLKGPAAAIVKSQYLQVFPWKPFSADSPGHTAMRQTLGNVDPDDSYVTGWISSYQLKAVLQRAAQDRALDRAGLIQAAKEISSVDYEGMLPTKAGNLRGTPNTVVFRESVIARPDEGEYTGLKVLTDFAAGSTADSYALTAPCYGSP